MKPKMKLKDGCPGCNRRWDAPRAEGQCSRCKRCLECCGHANIPYTCAWKWDRMSPHSQYLSRKSYDRWINNPNILSKNRRIV